MARIDLDLAHAYRPNPQRDEDYALLPLKMTFDDGGAYALLGPSGCGKTTLLNIVSGLVKPSQGSVRFDGVDVTARTPQQRNIAQVFQFPVIYDTMTVAGNLAFPLRNRGMDRAVGRGDPVRPPPIPAGAGRAATGRRECPWRTGSGQPGGPGLTAQRRRPFRRYVQAGGPTEGAGVGSPVVAPRICSAIRPPMCCSVRTCSGVSGSRT